MPGARFTGTIRLEHRAGKPFTLREALIEPGEITDVTARVEAVSPSVYDIVIEGSPGALQGPFSGKIDVTTDVPGEEHLTLRFLGSVTKPGAAPRGR